MYQNLKIAITDEVHLKAVCEVLQSMGYERAWWKTYSDSGLCVTTYISGRFKVRNDNFFHGYRGLEVTLTDLLALRDKHFMENIHA